MENLYDVVIIGSGPAGFTAAIYASRANFKVLLLEGEQPGGQLTTTTEVENFPGFPKGIMGPTLMNQMREQAQRFGAETKYEIVTSINLKSNIKQITTSSQTYIAKTVIIATGSRARYLGLESEERLRGKGVSACATCDGFFFKDKIVAVIGGGDSAMEEANFLTKFATKVYLVNRSENFKASPIMYDRAKQNPKIEFVVNKQTLEILGEKFVTGLKLKDNSTQEISELNVNGVFLAIGHQPNTELFKEQLNLENGYIITEADTSKTNIPGVFAAGDVKDRKHYWQGIIAAGTGAIAALDAQEYLYDFKHKEEKHD
ncbi:MAG: thioredoxin-disulfide reductase [Candidatus Woesearchaeota archaeon]